jgi:hypothetical protein
LFKACLSSGCARVIFDRHTRNRRFPGLPQCRDAGLDPAEVRHGPAPRRMNEVDRAYGRERVRRLSDRLPGREHGHDLQGIGMAGEQPREARARRR